MTAETLFYITQYADEVMPCDASLEGWAKWFSKPDPTWPHQIAQDGELFVASTLVATRITCTWRAGKWEHAEPPVDANSFFPHWAPGMGWDAEGERETLAECLAEGWVGDGVDGDRVEVSAVLDGPNVTLRFNLTEDGPRLYVVGEIGRA